MQFIDLQIQQQRIREKLEAGMQAVLRHGQYIMGPEVKELEKKLSDYAGVDHAVACASGTDALLLALMAFSARLGDAIFTTPFTFVAAAEVICALGATPVLVDIDCRTFNLDAAKLEQAIQGILKRDHNLHPLPRRIDISPLKPKGILPVDLFGLPADYDAIQAVAQRYGLWVVEDAAQSFGAEYHGRRACSLGDIGCTSFYPAKPLGCYGDGGMCFTSNDAMAKIMASIRVHGEGDNKYENIRIGICSRLDTLQAAILLAKFSVFPEEIELRQEVAARYTKALRKHSSVIPPGIPDGYKSSWAQYSVLAKDHEHRSMLQAKLKGAEIPTAIHYPKPLHQQPAYAYLGYQDGDFPISEDYASRIFSLPMHPYLKSEVQEKIARLLQP
jgi:dTDP-4-amino-4,6-dideoxygalactose transaminase